MRGQQRGPDEIDLWCMNWARQRRIALGIIEAKMIEPRERLGQLRCTLGKVRAERDGASYTRSNQIFPEVYVGLALDIHRASFLLPGRERLVMHLHYVWREIPVKLKCCEVPVSNAVYWTLVGNIKFFLTGYFTPSKSKAFA
jgi:hypothetical protein